MLKNLLEDIAREQEGYGIKIYIYDDCSTKEYSFNHNLEIKYYRSAQHFGKTKYYKLVSMCFEETEYSDADYFIMLPDDIRLAQGFFKKAIETWEVICDEKKICLNLLMDQREGKRSWGEFVPIKKEFGNVKIWHTQWNDLCFISTWKFFSSMKYRIRLRQGYHTKYPNRGSGVGETITRALNKVYNLYQVGSSLVEHGNHPSVMNSDLRSKIPLIAEITKIQCHDRHNLSIH